MPIEEPRGRHARQQSDGISALISLAQETTQTAEPGTAQAPARRDHGGLASPSNSYAAPPRQQPDSPRRVGPHAPRQRDRHVPPLSGSDAPHYPARWEHDQQWGAGQSADNHWVRLTIFGLIGGGVFIFGLIMQVALVQRLHMAVIPAYIIQGFISIQLSFFLNRYLTWRDRSVPFWQALWRFNAQKALMTAINMGAYALLIRLGVQYIIANIGLTAVFTPVNYVIGHYWSFSAKRAPAAVTVPPSDSGRVPRLLTDSLPFGFSAIGAIPVITGTNTERLMRARTPARDLEKPPARARVNRRYLLALTAIIMGSAVLRLWHLGTAPDWQMDEVTYTAIARNVLTHGTLNLPIAYGQQWKPFLYHPPFYFLLLARWFAITGVGIFQARLLGVIGVTVSLILLTRLIWKIHGPLTAVITALFIATDGWLLYVQRVSYMENILMVLVTGTFLAYRAALDSGRLRWYVLAGALGGASVIFKHTGGYVIAAVIIAWLMARRDHRYHLALLGTSLAIIVTYVLVMLHLYDVPGHNWYIDQTFVQILRTLGKQQTGGNLTSPLQFLHLATHLYAVFLPSLLIGFSGIILLAVNLIRSLRARNLAVFRDDVIFPAWALAGVIVFGAISLKYAQYFVMVLTPVYCYLWARIVRVARGRIRLSWMAVSAMAVLVSLGLVSFRARLAESPGNVFQEAGQYVTTHIPRQAIVIAETPVDYEIPQRWCSPNGWRMDPKCLWQATYIVTWQTYLQSVNPYKFTTFDKVLRGSVKVITIPGFNGFVTVWKVKRR